MVHMYIDIGMSTCNIIAADANRRRKNLELLAYTGTYTHMHLHIARPEKSKSSRQRYYTRASFGCTARLKYIQNTSRTIAGWYFWTSVTLQRGSNVCTLTQAVLQLLHLLLNILKLVQHFLVLSYRVYLVPFVCFAHSGIDSSGKFKNGNQSGHSR